MTLVDALSNRPLRIKDARGQSIVPLDPVALLLLRRYETVNEDVLRRIVGEDGVRIEKKEKAALLCGLGVGLLVVCLFLYALLIKGDFFSAPLARTSSLLYFGAIPWVIWYALKHARFKHVAAAMLKYLRCPQCGYDLRLLPVDATDRTTACPECGSAWCLPETVVADSKQAAGGR